MLSKRRTDVSISQYTLCLHLAACKSIYEKHNVHKKHLITLSCVYTLQKHFNDIPDTASVATLLHLGRWDCWKTLAWLTDNDYLEHIRPGHSLAFYNVTQKGEYLLRAYEIEMSRLINNLKNSKWKRIKDNDLNDIRAKFLRKATKKGAKLY